MTLLARMGSPLMNDVHSGLNQARVHSVDHLHYRDLFALHRRRAA